MDKIMEDKRITKTKANLKRTLTALLERTPFEKITVTEICREAQTGRITFYTYYEDKYALINEMFEDFLKEAGDDYHELLRSYPETSDRKGFETLLDCILRLIYRNYPFFSQATSEKNPYLFSSFFNYTLDSVDVYIKTHGKKEKRYPSRQLAALLCNGLLGVINTCDAEGLPQAETEELVKAMYGDILNSMIFEETEKK